MTIDLLFPGDTTWTPIAHLVSHDSLQIHQTTSAPDFQSSRDSASFSAVYDRPLASRLLLATDRIRVRIMSGSAFLFSGAVRPFTELMIRNGLGEIAFECIDNSELLNQAVGARVFRSDIPVFDPVNTVHSAVHVLLGGSGVTISAGQAAITTRLPHFLVEANDNRRDALESLLYFNGYTVDYLPNGEISFFPWVRSTIAHTYTFDDTAQLNIVDGSLRVTKLDEFAEDSVEVNFRHVSSVTGAIVFSRSEGDNVGGSLDNIDEYESHLASISGLQYVEVSNPRIEGSFNVIGRNHFIFADHRWLERKGISFAFTAVGQTQFNDPGGLGPQLIEFVIRPDYSFRARMIHRVNTRGTPQWWVRIRDFRIVVDAVVEGGNVLASSFGPRRTIQKISAKYLFSPDRARDFAAAYRLNVLANPFVFDLSSYIDRPLGEIVRIDTSTGGVAATGVIIQKGFNNQTLEFAYRVRSLSAITPSTGLPMQTPPVPLPVTGPPVIVPPIQAGQAQPGFLLAAETPSEFNQGLIVRAGGIEFLRVSFELRSPSPVLHSQVLPAGDFFLRVLDGLLYWIGGAAAGSFRLLRNDDTVIMTSQMNFGAGLENLGGCWATSIGDDGNAYALVRRGATTEIWIVNATTNTPVCRTTATPPRLSANRHGVSRFGGYFWVAVSGSIQIEFTAEANPGVAWSTLRYGTVGARGDEIYNPTLRIHQNLLCLVGGGWTGLTAITIDGAQVLTRAIQPNVGPDMSLPVVLAPDRIAVTERGAVNRLWVFDMINRTWTGEEFSPSAVCGMNFANGYFCGLRWNATTTRWDFGVFASLSYAAFRPISERFHEGFTLHEPFRSQVFAVTNTDAAHGFLGELMFRLFSPVDTGANFRTFKFRTHAYMLRLPPVPEFANFREVKSMLANHTGAPANHITFTAGQVYATDNVTRINSPSISKRLDAAWAAGNMVGGLDAGVRIANTWYSCWVIAREDGLTDYLFSTHPTAPTMPIGFIHRRRIGWIRTDANGSILPFFQAKNIFSWWTSITELNAAAPPNTSMQTLRLTVPPSTRAHFRLRLWSAQNIEAVLNIFSSRSGVNGNDFFTANPPVHSESYYETVVDSHSAINWFGSGTHLRLSIFTLGWEDLEI